MEATVICVDNSEYTRNGDFEPSRFQAQSDAINLLAGAKTGANPENTVGVLTCATTSGKSPKVMVTPTSDLGKVLTAMSQVNIEGEVDIFKSAQIAQLALKHRQNKNQRQRIVLFVGSPVQESQEQLVKVGKKLKKNNVSVDVVSFGDSCEANRERLEAFVQSVNKDSNSHLVEAPMGCNLCDFLLSTAVLGSGGDDGEAAGGGGGGGGNAFEFGVDPSIDPELALALRVSMEEEKARQQAAAAAAAAAAGGDAAAAADGAPSDAAAASAPAADAAADDGTAPMDEDELLQQALAMSMQEALGEGGTDKGAEPKTPAPASHPAVTDAAAMEEDDPDLAMALAMSLAEGSSTPNTAAVLSGMLSSLPGVDVNDPNVQAAINNVVAKDKEDGDKKEGDKESQ